MVLILNKFKTILILTIYTRLNIFIGPNFVWRVSFSIIQLNFGFGVV